MILAPSKLKYVLFFGALEDDGSKPYNKKALRFTLKQASHFSVAKEFIHFWSVKYIRYALNYIVPLTIIGIPTLYLDMNS